MSTSALYGSYAALYPATQTAEGMPVDKTLFAEGRQAQLAPFNEPANATKIRLALWDGVIRAMKMKDPTLVYGTHNSYPALFKKMHDGRSEQPNKRSLIPATENLKPVRYANPLYSVANPTRAGLIWDTDWTHYFALQNESYLQALQYAGVTPPLMTGFHLYSPAVNWPVRDAEKPGLPGVKHPPSAALSSDRSFFNIQDGKITNLHHSVLSKKLLGAHLGALGCASISEALERCRVTLRQAHPHRNGTVENPYLADYCFTFEK